MHAAVGVEYAAVEQQECLAVEYQASVAVKSKGFECIMLITVKDTFWSSTPPLTKDAE